MIVFLRKSFRNLFTTLINEIPDLSGSTKLLYLKKSLSGEAAELVAYTLITNDSFAGAWEDLEVRYGNPRVISSHYMKRFFSIPAVLKFSPLKVERLLDFFKRTILVRVLKIQKLDRSTRITWETSLKDSSQAPSFQALTKCLEYRVAALEFANATNSSYHSKITS